MVVADLADVTDVETAWRPLTPAESTRASYLISRASRHILRRWPDVEDRITATTLDPAAVVDAVVEMVLTVLTGPPVPGARSWQVTSGSESRAVTLAALADGMRFTDWMVELFEGRSSALPVHCMPAALSWPDAAR